MKKLLILLLALLMISQTALCAPYAAYPLGDGRVEITGTKNADKETTFLIKDLSGTRILDVGQVGMGEEEFSKILFIADTDGLVYNIEIGDTSVQVKNVSPEMALAELESAASAEFENVLIPYNKIFNADTSLMEPVYDKNAAYDALALYDFTTPQNVANEYADVLEIIINDEKAEALNLISQNRSSEALSKYIGHFDVDKAAYDAIKNKNLVYSLLDGKTYTESQLETEFPDVLTIAAINEASGDAFISLVRQNQTKIGLDLSEGANIAAIVFAKLDAKIFASYEAIKTSFIEEISLDKLNNATTDTVKSVLEAENAVLKILDTPGYSLLDEATKIAVCQAMARGNFESAEAARQEFANVVARAQTTTPAAPQSPSSSTGSGNYAVSGGTTQAPESPTSFPFADVDSFHWGYEAISSLYKAGIVSGTSATTYEPERLVAREEFVKMLVGTFGLYDSNAQNVFTDISDTDWCAPYVASAYAVGLTLGKGDGTFGKGETLTRQDMATLAARCADIAGLELKAVTEAVFADEAYMADYAVDSIYRLSDAGIINGMGDGTFSPNTGCTRAMAAKVCYELLKLYKGGAI